MAPDFENATYIINFGTSIGEAEYPMQTRARYMQKWFKRKGTHSPDVKHVIVNPRLSKAAAKVAMGDQGEWLPLRPATDGFFVLGLIRWIIENKAYDADFISRPSREAAEAGGYKNGWTDMTYLVSSVEPKVFLTGEKAGLKKSDFVVSVNGKVTEWDNVKGRADLDTSVMIGGVEYKTAFRMLRERAQEKTLSEAEDVCDIPNGTIARIAKEFSSAKKPVAEFYRGIVQHTNGWGNGRAVIMLNVLMGNINKKGGYTKGHLAYKGSPGYQKKLKPRGVSACRHKSAYEGKKKVPTRPWYPFASRDVAPEWWSSVRQGYPYKIKAVLNYYNGVAYTLPYNKPVVDAMKDTKAIPLYFSIDLWMGESSMYADYILPDTSYLERFGYFHSYPTVMTRVGALRQPVVGTLDPKTHDYRGVHPDTRTADDILIQLALKLGLPNFGKDGMGKGKDLFNAWDLWNEYYKTKHYEGMSGLDPNGPLARIGGLFENPANKYDGEYIKLSGGRIERPIFTYHNKVAKTKNSMTGRYFDALPTYRTIYDTTETPLKVDEKEYPFQICTHKDAYHTQSRTASNLWLMSIKPENSIDINPADAKKLGVSTGDWVRAKSPTSPVWPEHPNHYKDGWYKYKARVTSVVRPGVILVCHSYGRWGAGARPWYMDGKPQYIDERIGAGFQLNPLQMADPVLKNVVLIDPISGATEQTGTRIKIERI